MKKIVNFIDLPIELQNKEIKRVTEHHKIISEVMGVDYNYPLEDRLKKLAMDGQYIKGDGKYYAFRLEEI
jgi:hypothetical protein